MYLASLPNLEAERTYGSDTRVDSSFSDVFSRSPSIRDLQNRNFKSIFGANVCNASGSRRNYYDDDDCLA
jgi:hypothetical protein